MRTAIVATMKNEARRLPEFLASLEAQTRTPDAIVLTDGGSTDSTWELLSAFAADTSLPVQVERVPGNRSVGRNEGIRLSGADLIAVTDVAVLDPEWFENIIAPLEAREADVVAGWYEPLAEDPRDRATGLLTQFSLNQVDPDAFLPSSRSVAFTRAAWETVGGYPEALDEIEDTIFDLALRRADLRFAFASEAVARWHPPQTLRGVHRMEARNALGDGETGIFLWTYTRYALLYLAYGGGLLLLLLGFFAPLLWLLLGALTTAYVLFRIRQVLFAGLTSQIPHALLVAFLQDWARLVNYLRGRIRRRRSRRADRPGSADADEG